MIDGRQAQGVPFYFEIFDQTIKSEQVVEFLKHLLSYIEGDIGLI